MNTKYKAATTGAVPRTLGRPVGVLPLGPRPLAPSAQRKTSSTERRPLKRTPSTGSITSLSSARSTKSDASCASSRRHSDQKTSQPSQDVPGSDYGEEQDIKFIDCDAVSVSSGPHSGRPSSSRQSKKSPSTNDILDLCQETEPYKVYEIDLHGEELATVPDLEKFRKLRILDLSGNHIKRIQGLDFNKELKELKLYDNLLTTIEGLENLKDLCNLQLQHNKISSIGRNLASLKKLHSLRLDNNKLAKIDTPELLSCSLITVLDLSHNRLETLAPLSYLPNLEELYAAGNHLRKIGDLTKCKKLQEVDLSRNGLSELSGIANLPNLQNLDLSYNQLTTLKSVGKLRALEELNINANRVAELSYFASVFPKLQILFACDNMIARWDEICSLAGLPELVEMYMMANPFTMEDGEMPAYHHTITVALPQLEVIDGAHVKRPTGKSDGAAPVMRPMSASSIVSVRQVETQLRAAFMEQDSLFKNMSERFNSLRTLVDSLPSEPPRPMTLSSDVIPRPTTTSSDVRPPSSRCSRRSRIKEAQNFAAINFDSDDEHDI